MLGSGGKRLGAVRINEEDLVVVGVEADAGLGNVVGDDEIAVLADEFVTGIGLEVFGFRREADEGAGEAEGLAGGAEDVGGADEFEGERVAGFLDFPWLDGGGV